jgi:hypothetical protein
MLKSYVARSADEGSIRPLALRAGWTILLALCFGGVLAIPSFAQNAQPASPTIVAAQVRKFGVGKDVKVRLMGGEKLRGHISSIGDNSFTVKLRKTKTEREVPYSDVAMVKDPGPIFWILIGAAIVVIIIVAVR